jgi:hypothetical protein
MSPFHARPGRIIQALKDCWNLDAWESERRPDPRTKLAMMAGKLLAIAILFHSHENEEQKDDVLTTT